MTRLNTERTTSTKKTKIKTLGLVLLVAGIIATDLLLGGSTAHAATTLTVNDTGDGNDFNLFDGVCDSNQFASGLQCTLRAAIEQANGTTGADTINFNIPGSGVKDIIPTAALPPITDQVTIDGYTQPGSSPNTLAKGTDAKLMVQLTGFDAGSGLAVGLDIRTRDSVIKGLVINRFNSSGIMLDDDPASGTIASGNRIEGNFIGTDPSGAVDLGNGGSGVFTLDGTSNNTVGGDSPEARNLVSGNGFDGVFLGSGGSGNRVIGNLVGTGKDGTTPLGNDGFGVIIFGDSNTVFTNTIAFNGQSGTEVPQGAGNRVLSNSIFSNGDLGIDLDSIGVTKNDEKDSDTGANNLQNFPVLSSAKTAGGKTTAKGKLNSTPGSSFTVQIFSNPSGTDEGKTFIGQKSVDTDGSGNASFAFSPAQAVPKGQSITATATNNFTGDTSEFSAPKKVVSKKK